MNYKTWSSEITTKIIRFVFNQNPLTDMKDFSNINIYFVSSTYSNKRSHISSSFLSFMYFSLCFAKKKLLRSN